MTNRNWVIIAIVVFVMLVTAYFTIPLVRYLLIPIIGSTNAPIKVLNHPVPNTPLNKEYRFKVGTLANQKRIVSDIQQVPLEGGWINTSPLTFNEIANNNKLLLVDFWTYSCINCYRATPYTEELWKRYKNYGLVVIGIHTPEFTFEAKPQNILTAVKRQGITYPVLTDAYRKIWGAFGNHFWPAKYLITPEGNVIYTQFGEGNYAKENKVIRNNLIKLGWNPPNYGPPKKFLIPVNKKETNELYAGTGHSRKALGNKQQPEIGKISNYQLPKTIKKDVINLSGKWLARYNYLQSQSTGKIVLNYIANAVYIVLANAKQPVKVEVLLDGKPIPKAYQGSDIITKNGKTWMLINEPRLYFPIANHTPYQRRIITLIAPSGLRFYSFTFGSY